MYRKDAHCLRVKKDNWYIVWPNFKREERIVKLKKYIRAGYDKIDFTGGYIDYDGNEWLHKSLFTAGAPDYSLYYTGGSEDIKHHPNAKLQEMNEEDLKKWWPKIIKGEI